jgi:hypothetical protein
LVGEGRASTRPNDQLLAVAEPGAAVDVGVRTERLDNVRLDQQATGLDHLQVLRAHPRVTRGASAAPSTARAAGKTFSPTSWMALRAGGQGGVRGATRGGRGSNADLAILGLLSQADVHDVIRGVVDVHDHSRDEVAL